jgi:hypothetical protein
MSAHFPLCPNDSYPEVFKEIWLNLGVCIRRYVDRFLRINLTAYKTQINAYRVFLQTALYTTISIPLKTKMSLNSRKLIWNTHRISNKKFEELLLNPIEKHIFSSSQLCNNRFICLLHIYTGHYILRVIKTMLGKHRALFCRSEILKPWVLRTFSLVLKSKVTKRAF